MISAVYFRSWQIGRLDADFLSSPEVQSILDELEEEDARELEMALGSKNEDDE